MIRQIRAIERVPKLKAKLFDPTTSSNMGKCFYLQKKNVEQKYVF